MTADSSRPLTDREHRALDALAVGLAQSDPSFVTAMRTGRALDDGDRRPRDADHGPRGGRLLGLLLAQAALLMGACLLAGAVSIGALLLGPVAVLALGPFAVVVVGLLALRRGGRGRRRTAGGRS